jgi:hypothetical protein
MREIPQVLEVSSWKEYESISPLSSLIITNDMAMLKFRRGTKCNLTMFQEDREPRYFKSELMTVIAQVNE